MLAATGAEKKNQTAALVEVDRQEPAGLILKERVDAHHVAAGEVASHRGIVEWVERLIRALAALHLRELADPFHELVPTRRCVAWPRGLLRYEPRRKHIFAASEKRTKERHLLVRRARGFGLD